MKFAALGFAVVLGGCLAPIHARTAEVAMPGELRMDAHVPLLFVAVGDARAVAPGAEGEEPRALTIEGPSIGMDEVNGAGVFPFWWELSFAFGLFRPCETGVMLGLFRLGGELRCGLVQQRWGQPISLAISAAAAAVPLYDRPGLWWRGGVDLSRWWEHLALIGNLYVTSGPEAYLVGSPPEEHWDRPLEELNADEPGGQLLLSREELRLALALGLGVRASRSSTLAFVVGLTAHVVLAQGDLLNAECRGCSAVELADYDEGFGFTLTVGVSGAPRRPRRRRRATRSSRAPPPRRP